MSLRISEYGGYASGRPFGVLSARGFIRTQAITSTQVQSTGNTAGSSGNIVLSSGTYLVQIDSDFAALIAFGSSSSTAPNMTSTNAQRIPANVGPIPFYVAPYMNLFTSST